MREKVILSRSRRKMGIDFLGHWLWGIVVTLLVLNVSTPLLAADNLLQGVRPGETTKTQLLQHALWGKPTKLQKDARGREYLLYPKGRFQVAVTVVQDVVRTVDIRFPAETPVAVVEQAFRLGNVSEGVEAPEEASVGLSVKKSWDRRVYPTRNAVIFVQNGQGKQVKVVEGNVIIIFNADATGDQVALLRLHSPSAVPSTSTSSTASDELPECTTNMASEKACRRGIDLLQEQNFDEQKYNAALAAFAESIRLDPKHVCPYFYRAELYMRTGKYDEALADAKRAVSLAPDDPEMWSRLSEAFAVKEDFDSSIAAASKAIELDDQYVFGYSQRAITYFELGRDEEALADLNRAVQLAPELISCYLDRGWCLLDMGEIDRAMQDAEKAMQLEPNHPDPYCLRGDCHIESGRYREAIADCTKALELDPEYSRAYLIRAEAYHELGDRRRAREDGRKGEKLMLP